MTEHTITNVGPTEIKVTDQDGKTHSVPAGSVVTCAVARIIHAPKGRVEYTVRPREE